MADQAESIFGAGNLEYQMEQFIQTGGQDVKILLSGKTGVGKSHLTNALIGEELAEEGDDVDPMTDEVSLSTVWLRFRDSMTFRLGVNLMKRLHNVL